MAGQGELEIDPAIRRKLFLALQGAAFLAEIDQSCGNVLDIGVVEGNGSMHGDAAAAPLFALHESTRGTQAAPGAVFGDGFVQNKVDAQGKHPADIVLRRSDSDDQRGRAVRRRAYLP